MIQVQIIIGHMTFKIWYNFSKKQLKAGHVLAGFLLYESCLRFSGLYYGLLGSFFPSQGNMNIGYDFMSPQLNLDSAKE